jgi:hypothetical protein
LVVGPISTAPMRAYCTLTPQWSSVIHLQRRCTPSGVIHEITRLFYMPQSCGHGTHILLPLRRKARLRIFTTPEKSNGFGRD